MSKTDTFGVPSANMMYQGSDLEEYSPIHYAAHIHDPYDTVELARQAGRCAGADGTGRRWPPPWSRPGPDLQPCA